MTALFGTFSAKLMKLLGSPRSAGVTSASDIIDEKGYMRAMREKVSESSQVARFWHTNGPTPERVPILTYLSACRVGGLHEWIVRAPIPLSPQRLVGGQILVAAAPLLGPRVAAIAAILDQPFHVATATVRCVAPVAGAPERSGFGPMGGAFDPVPQAFGPYGDNKSLIESLTCRFWSQPRSGPTELRASEARGVIRLSSVRRYRLSWRIGAGRRAGDAVSWPRSMWCVADDDLPRSSG